MGLMDLFRRKPETRATGAGYTAALLAARDGWISGSTGLAEATATVQSCVSLWENAFAMAAVSGTDILDRRTLALAARALAIRGEAVFLIRDGRLVPASDWDVATVDGFPRAYRLSIPDAGGGRSATQLAGEVLHFRIGADPAAPWSGRSPLSRAALSAGLLHEIETALRDVFRDAPLGGQTLPLPAMNLPQMEAYKDSFRGKRGRVLMFAAQVTGELQPVPAEQLTPHLEKAETVAHLTAARDSVAMAFGVLPALLNASTTGPVVREAQRHLAAWTLQPIANLIAEEASAKLGTAVTIDTILPLQAHDAGGRARALSAVIEAMGRAKELGLSTAEVSAAAQMINFGGGSDLA